MYGADLAVKVPPMGPLNYGMNVKGTPSGAEACDGCNKCAGQCPVGIDIPKELKKVANHFKDAKVGW